MLNDETRRKLRILNVGEFIEELEIQQQDPQTLALLPPYPICRTEKQSV